MLVVGDREAEAGTVAVRLRGHGDLGAHPLDVFAERAAGWRESRQMKMNWDATGDGGGTSKE
jgi:threonyl-tRNA synthetase